MPPLTISTRIELPTFGTWEWTSSDYEQPVRFASDGWHTEIRLREDGTRVSHARHLVLTGEVRFATEAPTPKLLAAVRSSGPDARELAEQLHAKYVHAYRQLEILLRTRALVRDLPVQEPVSSWEGLFPEGSDLWTLYGRAATWQIGDGPSQPFHPRPSSRGGGRRRIRELFKRRQLVTAAKWRDLQRGIDEGINEPAELIELLRSKARLEGTRPKIPTIEAAVLIESLLRSYCRAVLRAQGLSNNQIDELKTELTFNVFLNLVLPLTLTRSQLQRSVRHVRAVNALRKIRNHLVHGDMTDDEIDVRVVARAIESGTVLIAAIRQRRRQLHIP